MDSHHFFVQMQKSVPNYKTIHVYLYNPFLKYLNKSTGGQFYFISKIIGWMNLILSAQKYFFNFIRLDIDNIMDSYSKKCFELRLDEFIKFKDKN